MSDIQRMGLRHDDLSDWESGNPTLVADETVLIDDTGMVVRGDGSAFNTSYTEVGVLGATGMINGGFVGDIIPRNGNAVDPSESHPRFCLTNFSDSASLSSSNWPDLVPWLRDQKVIYLEGLTGETSAFAGSASGSVITLDNTTANNDLVAALTEFQIDYDDLTGDGYTNWLTLDWDGTTYAITDVDAATRQITVTGTPTAGAGNVTIYPSRIAGSTTTARVHSAVGKDLRAAGTTEYLAGLMWRDRFQGFGFAQSSINLTEGNADNLTRPNNVGFGGPSRGAATTLSYTDQVSNGGGALQNAIGDNGTDGTPRTGTTTRGAGMGVNFYIHGGRYLS